MKLEAHLIKFMVGGLIAVSIDWGVFWLLTHILDFTNTLSKTLSFMSGMLFAFVFNGLITFTSYLSFQKLGRHLVVYVSSLILNIWIFDTIIRTQSSSKNLNTLLALLSATAVSAASNFFGMRYWVFYRKVSTHE
jgi:putative flippase GtrA